MNTKLILVEGLPGFGKSTTAKIIHDTLVEKNIDVQLYLEGDLNHPADYDRVACFTKEQYEQLIVYSGDLVEAIKEHIIFNGGNYLVPYGKMKYDFNIEFPESLFNWVFQHDIYELPFDQNMELITNRWEEFAQNALRSDKIYIFECCFIQNPVTIGMVKYNGPREKVIDYVKRLEKIIERLNPTLFYVEQNNLEFSFRKAVQERPKMWYEGFIDYYTNQGFGKEKNYKGLEGTLKVLEERLKLEAEIYDRLNIKKHKVNNSNYEQESYKMKLMKSL
ncbi:hypothetical protein [Ornithinibacillus sp. 179-J 7C1 HS]|uniref:hypothetical protein n=1 Tax=Ornithinibacillus sp. 179-J 7C1 HS TaxID=3142384 RepID=UPI0039A3BC33